MAMLSRIVRLLWGVISCNSAAPSAMLMPNSEVVAHTSAKPMPSTSPAPGPNTGIPVVRVRRYRPTIARLPATPAIKMALVGQRSTSGA